MIRALFKITTQNDFKDLEDSIKNAMNNLSGIINLHTSISNRESANKKKMYEVAKNSELFFYLDEEVQTYKVSIRYGDVLENRIAFGDLLDLRDRAYLIIYSENKELE